jgi:hypothetical protein
MIFVSDSKWASSVRGSENVVVVAAKPKTCRKRREHDEQHQYTAKTVADSEAGEVEYKSTKTRRTAERGVYKSTRPTDISKDAKQNNKTELQPGARAHRLQRISATGFPESPPSDGGVRFFISREDVSG